MKILIEIGHPKQVHFWKYSIKCLENNGHEILVMTKDKDVILYLLNHYNIRYVPLGKTQKGWIKKAYGLSKAIFKVITIANNFKPDIFIGGADFAISSKIFRKRNIFIHDTEHAAVENYLTYSFSDIVCTPLFFKEKVPKEHITYDGFEELAYLNPDYFTPDPMVLEEAGLTANKNFIIMRFVAWNASHDVNQYGISKEMKLKYISELGKYGRVIISSEVQLEKEFEKYKLNISPEKFHSLLSFAQLYIGEGGSIASEAAIMGTPSIHISSTAKFCGNFDELHRYGLIYTFSDDEKALKKAVEILQNPDSKKEWKEKKEKLLTDKIDVVKFMTAMIESYNNGKV